MFKLAALLLPLLISPFASFASVDQGLLALVPAETVVLTGVDVASAKNSDFGQFLLSRMNTVNSDALSFMQQSGFDPRRDVQNFLFAGFGPRQTQGRSKFAVLARGTFDQNAIASAAQAKTAITPQQYAGLTLYVNNSRKIPTAFAFPDTGIAVMGDLATVQEIVDHLASPSVLDPGLVQRVSNIGSKNDVWFASLLLWHGSRQRRSRHRRRTTVYQCSSAEVDRSIGRRHPVWQRRSDVVRRLHPIAPGRHRAQRCRPLSLQLSPDSRAKRSADCPAGESAGKHEPKHRQLGCSRLAVGCRTGPGTLGASPA